MLCLNIEEEKHYLRQRKRGNAVMSEERKVLRGQFSSDSSSTTGSFLFGTEAVSIFFTNHHSVDHCNDYKSVG